jgi:hypothetical protein
MLGWSEKLNERGYVKSPSYGSGDDIATNLDGKA